MGSAEEDALARLLQKQEEFERRLIRVESALKLGSFERAEAPALVPIPPPLPESVPGPAGLGFETSIGLTLINRVGVVTLVLGIGFLFKYAVDNNYVGPAGRVWLGLLAGLLAIGGADVLWRRGQKIFAQGATAAGISVLYLALFAAFGFYRLIPQQFAFLAMAATTAAAGALALRYDAIAISALGLFGGLLTPILLSGGENRPWFLFTYVLILDLGALALARLKNWRPLEILSFTGTVLIYAGWFSNYHSQSPVAATVFIFVFHALFAVLTSFEPIFLVSQVLTALGVALIWRRDPGAYFPLALAVAAGGLAADLRGRRYAVIVALASFWIWQDVFGPDSFLGLTCGFVLFLGWILWRLLVRRRQARGQDLAILALNGAAYFGSSYFLLNPRYHAWMGLFAVALGTVYLGLGYLLWNRQPRAGSLAASAGAAFLTLAIPIQFSAWRATMAWSLEAAAFSWIGARTEDRRITYASLGIFVLALIRLLSVDAWVSQGRFVAFAVTAVCLFLAARWTAGPARLRLAAWLAGHFVLLWAITRELLDWVGRDAAPENVASVKTISVSLLFAVYALGLVSLGVAARSMLNRLAGLALIGFVVLKLYLFDVWQLGRVYRTLAFVALGILLLSTSFLYSHFHALIESWWKKDESPDRDGE